MIRLWKFLLPFLFALAVLLGLYRNSQKQYSYDFAKKQLPASSGDLNYYYQKAEEITRGQNTETTVSFLAVGDIMLSRGVAAAEANYGQKDWPNFPFQKIAEVLKSTNFNFANLESPFVFRSCGAIAGGHSLIFGAACQSVEGLKTYNFNALNLANNHAMDQGLGGLTITKDLLKSSNLQTTGTGTNLDDAWRPAIVEANGLKICFVGASYSSINDSGATRNNYVARIEDLPRLKSLILNLKSTCDFIVATMHAGVEYTRTPNTAQIKFARAAIDYGADVVIGAHPHWVQTIEKYCPAQYSPPVIGGAADEASRGGKTQITLPPPPASRGTPPVPGGETAPCPNPKYIFYSLGNFIFDQDFSQETKEGLALKIQISKSAIRNSIAPDAASADDLQGTRQPAKLESIELIPVIIENSQPRLATNDEAKKILEKIGENKNILLP